MKPKDFELAVMWPDTPDAGELQVKFIAVDRDIRRAGIECFVQFTMNYSPDWTFDEIRQRTVQRLSERLAVAAPDESSG